MPTNMKSKILNRGFTLLEMLLVLVIVSIIILGSIGFMQQRAEQMRIDRTAAQLQQILNAALAYYVANGYWPGGFSELRNGFYLPPASVPFQNPWGGMYFTAQGSPSPPPPPAFGTPPPLFYAWTIVPGSAGSGNQPALTAAAITNALPLGYTSGNPGIGDHNPPTYGTPCAADANCSAAGSVNIPGQNINAARGVNFAGLYHHGGCVPVPQCPIDATGQYMRPEIMVVPVSVSGYKDYDPAVKAVYPISSFTAYAKGSTPNLNTSPPQCEGSTLPAPSCTANISGNPASAYWRVCLQVVTERGNVQPANLGSSTEWGLHVTLMAITRCAVNNEPAGSSFSVFTN